MCPRLVEPAHGAGLTPPASSDSAGLTPPGSVDNDAAGKCHEGNHHRLIAFADRLYQKAGIISETVR